MGIFGKAFDNANGILESANTFLDREVQLRSLKAADKTNELLAIKMMQENAERAAVAEQKAKEDAYRQKIKNNPKCMRAVKAKQMEILEKTGNAVSIDAIIDVLYGKEDELTAEEEAELIAIQKQIEDEEECQIDEDRGLTFDEISELTAIKEQYKFEDDNAVENKPTPDKQSSNASPILIIGLIIIVFTVLSIGILLLAVLTYS